MPLDARLRHTLDVRLLRPVATVWLVLAELTLGVALAGAIVLYSHRKHTVQCYAGQPGHGGCTETLGWVAPTALGIVLLAFAVALGLVLTGRRAKS